MGTRQDDELFSTIEIAARLNLEIVREGIRQARKSFSLSHNTFQLSIIMTAASGFIGCLGIFLLLLGHADEGTATTAGGVTSSLIFSQRSKEAREQLDNANKRLDSLRQEIWDGELTSIFYPLLKEL